MARTRRLITDADFLEAQERGRRIRVFQDDHIVDSGGIIIRYTDDDIIIQSGVGDITYHSRQLCEFFETIKS